MQVGRAVIAVFLHHEGAHATRQPGHIPFSLSWVGKMWLRGKNKIEDGVK